MKNLPKFFQLIKKTDAIISLIIGFLIGVFFFIILETIEIKIPYSLLLIIIFPTLSTLGMLIASLLGKKFLIILQLAKFVLVGALNTFVDLGLLNALIWISGIATGSWYSVFKGISFLVATVNSYFWNKHWTFEKRERIFVSGEFSKFLVVVSIGFAFNVGIASIIVNVIGPQFGITEKIWATVGAFLAGLTAWLWNFLSAKFIVFKK